MTDEVKQAIEEMVKASEGNPEARAFLKGVKAGLEYGGKGEVKKEA